MLGSPPWPPVALLTDIRKENQVPADGSDPARVTWPALRHRCHSGGGRRCGEAPPVTRSARDAEADLIRAGQAPARGPQHQPGAACPDYTCGTALGQPRRRALRNRMAMAGHAAHRRPAGARAWATSQTRYGRRSRAGSRVRGSGGTCRSGTATRRKGHGRATRPVRKGLVDAGAAVYGLRGS
jgi:hypothetical protein